MTNDFEKETTGRLAGIEKQLEMLIRAVTKLDNVNDTANAALQSSKSAHHRLDRIEIERTSMRQELNNLIDDKINNIYKIAAVAGGIIGAAISIIGVIIRNQ